MTGKLQDVRPTGMRTSARALRTIATAMLLAWTTTVGTAAGQPPAQAKTGVLVLAHGGSPQWNDNVAKLAARLDQERPVEVAFGMATRANIQRAIDALVAKGVTEIVAVPLFISSHSSVVTSTQSLLGLRAAAPADLSTFARMSHGSSHASGGHEGHGVDPTEGTRPVKSPVPVRMSGALDSHPIVTAILADRARAISKDPAHE